MLTPVQWSTGKASTKTRPVSIELVNHHPTQQRMSGFSGLAWKLLRAAHFSYSPKHKNCRKQTATIKRRIVGRCRSRPQRNASGWRMYSTSEKAYFKKVKLCKTTLSKQITANANVVPNMKATFRCFSLMCIDQSRSYHRDMRATAPLLVLAPKFLGNQNNDNISIIIQ